MNKKLGGKFDVNVAACEKKAARRLKLEKTGWAAVWAKPPKVYK